MERRFRSGWLAVGLAVLACALSAQSPAASGASVPPALEAYFTDVVGLSAAERQQLLSGVPVTRLYESISKEQVTVFGAIWIDAPIARFTQAQRQIETFERGRAFPVTRRVSSPPRLDDFRDLRLGPDEARSLATCRPGSCELKLDAAAIAELSSIDWRSGDRVELASRFMQRTLHRYATAYERGGNTALPVYRDKGEPMAVDEEFRELLLQLPPLPGFLPDIGGYLLEYPRAWLPGSTSYLYWQETLFGLKPTLRLNHLTLLETSREVVVASKMLYASHYFRSALEVRIAVPDPARGGFWLTTVSSSRADGLTGFTGLFVRGRVRGEVRKGIETVLRNTKTRLEAGT